MAKFKKTKFYRGAIFRLRKSRPDWPEFIVIENEPTKFSYYRPYVIQWASLNVGSNSKNTVAGMSSFQQISRLYEEAPEIIRKLYG